MTLEEMNKERNQLYTEIQEMKDKQREQEEKQQENMTIRNTLKEKINKIENEMMAEKKQYEQGEIRKHELEKERENLKLAKAELIDKHNEISALVRESYHTHD